MLCIWEKFRIATRKDIPLKIIWDHLESMYDLMALVSNIIKERDLFLSTNFLDLIKVCDYC